MALCVVACATYEDAPPLGSGGADTSSLGGSGGSGAGTALVAGTTAVSSAGTHSLPVGGSAGSAGSTVSGGLSASGGGGGSGTPPSSEGGEGGAAPVINDACPDDPAKTAPGVCGCGFPDADTAELAGCAGLKSALVHRYDFEGTGTVVTDRVGTAHGTIMGSATLSQLAGKGVVVLTGGTTGPYVDLPNGLISALTSATLEAWVTWGGGTAWQRIFDFGDSTSVTPEDNPANGKSYLFLTPSDATGGVMRGVYSLTGGAAAAETRAFGSAALPQALAQVALVVDSVGGKLLLYADGVKSGEQTFSGSLASINDVNAWLGRSQYNADAELNGTFHDFRIYEAALTPLQIATSFAGGPDPAFLSK